MMYCPWTQEELDVRIAQLPTRGVIKVVLDRCNNARPDNFAVEPNKVYEAVRAPGRRDLVVTDDVGRQRYIKLGTLCRHHNYAKDGAYAIWLPAECSLL